MLDSIMHWLGFGLCHQLPARSFVAGGHQLPVCARDTGIYFGFVVSLAIIAALDRKRRRSDPPPAWVIALGVVFLLVMAWDGVTSYAGLRETTNLIRLVTGVGAGFALPLMVAPILNEQLWAKRETGRLLGEPVEGLVWLLAAAATIGALWWVGPMLGAGYALLTAVAILVTFTTVNLVIVSMIPRFEHRAAHLADLWPALVIAFGVTIAELALADVVRLALLRLVARL